MHGVSAVICETRWRLCHGLKLHFSRWCWRQRITIRFGSTMLDHLEIIWLVLTIEYESWIGLPQGKYSSKSPENNSWNHLKEIKVAQISYFSPKYKKMKGDSELLNSTVATASMWSRFCFLACSKCLFPQASVEKPCMITKNYSLYLL